jgi:hypothetical protein
MLPDKSRMISASGVAAVKLLSANASRKKTILRIIINVIKLFLNIYPP